MLKGKKSAYILLPVVLLIWGVIGYRVVDAFSEKDEVMPYMATIKPIKLTPLKRKKFIIGTVDRDPFLGTIYKPLVKKVVTPTAVLRKKDTLVWPSIRYKGLVTGTTVGNAVYLIELDGMAQLFQKRQAVADITLVRGDETTVLLRYKGRQKSFKIVH